MATPKRQAWSSTSLALGLVIALVLLPSCSCKLITATRLRTTTVQLRATSSTTAAPQLQYLGDNAELRRGYGQSSDYGYHPSDYGYHPSDYGYHPISTVYVTQTVCNYCSPVTTYWTTCTTTYYPSPTGYGYHHHGYHGYTGYDGYGGYTPTTTYYAPAPYCTTLYAQGKNLPTEARAPCGTALVKNDARRSRSVGCVGLSFLGWTVLLWMVLS